VSQAIARFLDSSMFASEIMPNARQRSSLRSVLVAQVRELLLVHPIDDLEVAELLPVIA
jgi:hypothetical protein